jgi:hypothetical protein
MKIPFLPQSPFLDAVIETARIISEAITKPPHMKQVATITHSIERGYLLTIPPTMTPMERHDLLGALLTIFNSGTKAVEISEDHPFDEDAEKDELLEFKKKVQEIFDCKGSEALGLIRATKSAALELMAVNKELGISVDYQAVEEIKAMKSVITNIHSTLRGDRDEAVMNVARARMDERDTLDNIVGQVRQELKEDVPNLIPAIKRLKTIVETGKDNGVKIREVLCISQQSSPADVMEKIKDLKAQIVCLFDRPGVVEGERDSYKRIVNRKCDEPAIPDGASLQGATEKYIAEAKESAPSIGNMIADMEKDVEGTPNQNAGKQFIQLRMYPNGAFAIERIQWNIGDSEEMPKSIRLPFTLPPPDKQ